MDLLGLLDSQDLMVQGVQEESLESPVWKGSLAYLGKEEKMDWMACLVHQGNLAWGLKAGQVSKVSMVSPVWTVRLANLVPRVHVVSPELQDSQSRARKEKMGWTVFLD